MHGGPQDVADFLFHAATVAFGAALQSRFHTVFYVSDNELCHGASLSL